MTMLSYWLILVIASSLPFVGIAISMALSQVLAFGLIALAFAVDRADPSQPASPMSLLAGLRMGRETAGRLVQLGLIYGALIGVLMLISMGLDPSTGPAAPVPQPPGDPSPDETISQVRQSVPDSFLLLAVLYVPMLMAFWFAPQLVAWQGLPPIKALFFSFVAVWLNKGAFLRYSLLWLAVIFLASICLGLVITAVGLKAGALLMAVLPLSMVLMAIGHASAYVSTREVLGGDELPVLPTDSQQA
jgi:hypothetical protein